MLESDISSDAVSAVMAALKRNLVGQRLRKGADLAKVLEASLKESTKRNSQGGILGFLRLDSKLHRQRRYTRRDHVCRCKRNGKTTTVAKVAHNLKRKDSR